MAELNADLFPVQLDPATTTFQANGHTYHVEYSGKLSITRDRWLERFSLYAMTGRDARSLLAEVRRVYDALNTNKPADAAIILDNLMRGVADLMSRESPLLYICTLFINREDELRQDYSEELARQKIEDWGGIESEFFFRSAVSFLKITDEGLSMLTQISLGQVLPKLGLQTP